MSLEIAEIRRLLDYDPATGIFRWRITRQPGIAAGDIAGGFKKGYRVIRIYGKKYPASRLAWVISHGEWPPDQIDHINRNPGDDRLENLRLATHAENCRNRKRRIEAVMPKGVRKSTRPNRYEVRIMLAGKRHHFGRFRDIEHAAACYRILASGLHGEFACGG